MRGDDRVRFCDSCSKNVYNLAGLTAVEATELIGEAEGHVCLRLYRRRDGTLLTADCPVGLRPAVRRRLLRLATIGVMMVATLRSGLWLSTLERRGLDLPPVPTGPGVTLVDWADWAAVALGIKRPNRVIMGLLKPPPISSAGRPGSCLPGGMASGADSSSGS